MQEITVNISMIFFAVFVLYLYFIFTTQDTHGMSLNMGDTGSYPTLAAHAM